MPIPEIIFRIVEDLTGFIGVLVWVSSITRDNWGIIEEIEEATAVTGEDDLFFGTFDRCGELGCVCLLQFLPGLQLSAIRKAGHEGRTNNVGQLSFSNQVFCLCSDEFLLQRDQFRAFWLLGLQLRHLIHDLSFVVSRGLNALLGIADGLQDGTAIIDVVCIQVLLLTKLREQYAYLVGDVGDRIVGGRLAPVGKLGCDGQTLFACSLIVGDQVVFGFDELVELPR